MICVTDRDSREPADIVREPVSVYLAAEAALRSQKLVMLYLAILVAEADYIQICSTGLQSLAMVRTFVIGVTLPDR